MRSDARLSPNPVGQLLVAVALGLLGTAVVFDLIDLATATGAFSIPTYWLISGGIAGALLAAPFGVAEWLQVPAGSPARRLVAQQAACNAVVLLLFVASWRLRDDQGLVPVTALALSLAGATLGVTKGWLGGEVSRAAEGPADDAGLDAPNSLGFEDSTLPGAVREPPLRAG